MPLNPAGLPPAVPPFDPDIDHACRELGRALLYVAQLTTLLNQRAGEANRLDDDLQAARLRIQELERDLQAARVEADVLRAAANQDRGK